MIKATKSTASKAAPKKVAAKKTATKSKTGHKKSLVSICKIGIKSPKFDLIFCPKHLCLRQK